MEYKAFRCLDCKVISIFPASVNDGRRCLDCGGFFTPLGNAKVHGKKISGMTIDVKVNTKQLDKALKKAEKLAKVVADLNMEINFIGGE